MSEKEEIIESKDEMYFVLKTRLAEMGQIVESLHKEIELNPEQKARMKCEFANHIAVAKYAWSIFKKFNI